MTKLASLNPNIDMVIDRRHASRAEPFMCPLPGIGGARGAAVRAPDGNIGCGSSKRRAGALVRVSLISGPASPLGASVDPSLVPKC
jgi:hypothetical protein